MQNQFAGGPQVNEKFSENYGTPRVPMTDLEGNKIKQNLYGSFEVETQENLDKSQDTNEKSKNKLSEKVLNSPDYPSIQRLYEAKKISVEEYESFIDVLEKNNGELLDDFEKKLEEHIDGDKSLDEKKADFSKDLKLVSQVSDYFDGVEKKEVDSIDFQLYKIIGENYSKLDLGEGKFDVEKDISTSINVSANKIISKHKTINKDSQTYKNAIKDIRTGDIKEKVLGLKNLCLLSFTSAGSIGKKSEKHRRDAYSLKEQREIYLQERIDILEGKLNSSNKKEEKEKEKIKEEIYNLNKELEEINSGEVFNSGELDTSNESGEEIKEEPSKPVNNGPTQIA